MNYVVYAAFQSLYPNGQVLIPALSGGAGLFNLFSEQRTGPFELFQKVSSIQAGLFFCFNEFSH